MNALSRICWIAAVLAALGGMIWGIVMSATGDHMMAPAHAHLNLLGWVTLALYGTFYALVPAAASWRISQLQVAAAIIGTILIVPGIFSAIKGTGEGLAKAGSMLVFLAMLLFLAIAVLATRKTAQTARPAPAE